MDAQLANANSRAVEVRINSLRIIIESLIDLASSCNMASFQPGSRRHTRQLYCIYKTFTRKSGVACYVCASNYSRMTTIRCRNNLRTQMSMSSDWSALRRCCETIWLMSRPNYNEPRLISE